ncbi:hypothetical protein [Caballeronia sp. SL2Y3]|uniref:hypothetical protein n=1 Tax=Caballeronia sp. SL2Y3 TaxID=2878151 RepID=UPI001FD108C4|nr:hypothetical protein [Caballeronia sp. SL2Y3]
MLTPIVRVALSFELLLEPPDPLDAPAIEIETFVEDDELLVALVVPPATSL